MSQHEDFTSAWLSALDVVYTGDSTSPRGIPTKESLFDTIVVHNPLTFPISGSLRNFRNVIGIIEGLSLVGQLSLPELLTSRVKKFNDFTDGGILHGAYSSRAYGALDDLVSLLARDPSSRQAVLTLYDSHRDLNVSKRDVPCTIAIQFLVRDARLHMRVMMRSNDVWLGMPYDFMQFAILQAAIAQALGYELGDYVHQTGSLHIYESDIAKVYDVFHLWYTQAYYPSSPQVFPLFDKNAVTIGEIGARARAILLASDRPTTSFETYANGLLAE